MNNVQVAALQLATSTGLLFPTKDLSEDQLLVLCTLDKGQEPIDHLKAVVKAIRPFLHADNCNWQFCLFTPSGLYECHSTGLSLDCYEEPLGPDDKPLFSPEELVGVEMPEDDEYEGFVN